MTVSFVVFLSRITVNRITASETVEPADVRTLCVADSTTANDAHPDDTLTVATESTSVLQEMMVVDKPAHGWTLKSLLEGCTNVMGQDEISSSSEATQTGRLQHILLCLN